jgi:hypothetical protein
LRIYLLLYGPAVFDQEVLGSFIIHPRHILRDRIDLWLKCQFLKFLLVMLRSSPLYQLLDLLLSPHSSLVQHLSIISAPRAVLSAAHAVAEMILLCGVAVSLCACLNDSTILK